MEDIVGFAVSLVNKIISRFVSDDDGDHHHGDIVWETFLNLMNRYRMGGLKNMKEVREKFAELFCAHPDILEDLSYFTTEIPDLVQKKERVQRASSKFMVDYGGSKKSGRDKRKRDGPEFEGKRDGLEFEEANNLFQCGDYAEEGFKHFEKESKNLCISVESFQFLMSSSFRISRDELETMVAPIVANMVDELPQKDPDLIKEFVHDFVGFCKYVEKHDSNFSAEQKKKEKLEQRKRRKVENHSGCNNYCTKARKRNKYDQEAALNDYEDERFELDRALNPLRSAIEKLQNFITKNAAFTLETPIDLENYFSPLDLTCIQSFYGDKRKDVRDDILSKDTTVGLSIALTRMKRKRREVEHSIERISVRN